MRAFTVQLMPSGKWRLTHNDVDMGVFETRFAAEQGMARIVNKEFHEYNEKGQEINELGEVIK